MPEEPKPAFKVRDLRGQPKESDLRPEAPPPETEPKEEGGARGGEGPVTFSTFLYSLCSSALIHLGAVENPVTRRKEKNLAAAKQEIDIIEMLAAKTKGNLERQERQLVEEALYDLRLRYVEANRKK